MATIAQTTANQANAQHSTGPKTEAGKANSSQNHFRHGFTGQFCLLPTDDPRSYQHLVDKLKVDLYPDGLTEDLLVERMAQHEWLRARAVQVQNSTLAFPSEDEERDLRQLALYLRYQTTHERAFRQLSDELRKTRNERRKQEIGFECGACKIGVGVSGKEGFSTGFGEVEVGSRGQSGSVGKSRHAATEAAVSAGRVVSGDGRVSIQ